MTTTSATRVRALTLGTAACLLGLAVPAGAIAAPAATTPRARTCSPPTAKVTYSSGTATVKVRSGPQAGSYPTRMVSPHVVKSTAQISRTGSLKVAGFWQSKSVILTVILADRGECAPFGAYVEVDLVTDGGDYHAYTGTKACAVTIGSLSPTSVSGKLSCSSLKLAHGQTATTDFPATLKVKGSYSLTS